MTIELTETEVRSAIRDYVTKTTGLPTEMKRRVEITDYQNKSCPLVTATVIVTIEEQNTAKAEGTDAETTA